MSDSVTDCRNHRRICPDFTAHVTHGRASPQRVKGSQPPERQRQPWRQRRLAVPVSLVVRRRARMRCKRRSGTRMDGSDRLVACTVHPATASEERRFGLFRTICFFNISINMIVCIHFVIILRLYYLHKRNHSVAQVRF